jgi:hypothetical protein
MIEVIPTMQTPYLTVESEGKTLDLLPVPRVKITQLRSLFVELQSYWIEYGFSTAELLADDRCWKLMGTIAELLPQAKNPAVTGFDLEPLQTDWVQLERLFLTQDRGEIKSYRGPDGMILEFYIDVFRPCKILESCGFEGRLVIQDAHQLWKSRQSGAVDEAVPLVVSAEQHAA